MNKFLPIIFGLSQLFALSAAHSAEWKVNYERSKIEFTATQNGSGLTGNFTSWSSKIDFDPNQLETSHISAEIALDSISAGDKQIEDLLKTSDWFDTTKFPKAVFKSDQIVSLGKNRYEAQGQLTIKDSQIPVALNFNLTIDGPLAKASGMLQLLRTDFNLGNSTPEATVAVPVLVMIRIEAEK
ncbi:YceI family protein [Polycladidibacter stylochi]|uniref:YceI family protein n=1 Tax=Polycladidibacter stylochi TaxID=1807766 RepID=UPI000830AA5E|nr:YceI family protein [Pseudovibrio stylochi]